MRMGRKGELEKTLQRDGKRANVTEGGNMGPPYQDTGSVVMYNLYGERRKHRPKATEAKEGQEGETVPVGA